MSVISPERVLFEGTARGVIAPAFDGEMGILPMHAPLMTLLGKGTLRLDTAEGVRLVRGSHIVTKKLFDHPKCYFFQGEDGRIIFAIPYETDFTLIGTTDQPRGMKFEGTDGWVFIHIHGCRVETEPKSLLKETIGDHADA